MYNTQLYSELCRVATWYCGLRCLRLLLEPPPLPASVSLPVARAGPRAAIAVPLPAAVSMATGPLTVTVVMTTSRAMTAEM